ncbi:MAG: peptidoglycan DD-metalloendopeptidase family protein [Actinomycetia bacterium]|nr:peptidoglycan DD-metalloendopeptidase family protein [Actinomycetes bacterium]
MTLGVVAAATAQTADEEKRQVESELEDLTEHIETARSAERILTDEITARNQAIRERMAQVAELGVRADELRSRAQAARERLRAADEELAQVERHRALAIEAHEIAQKQLERRVVEIYRSERVSTLSVVLGAASLKDLIDIIVFQRDTIEWNAQLVGQVLAAGTDLEEARSRARTVRANRERRAQLALDRAAEVRKTRASIASQRQQIVTLRDEGEQALASIEVEREEYEAEVALLEAESARLEAVIQRVREERGAAREAAREAREAREATEQAAREARAARDTEEQPGTPLPPPQAALPPELGDGPAEGTASSTAPLAWPLRGQLTSLFGTRWGRLHTGIDIAAPSGTPVGAASDGVVIFVGWLGGYGRLVLVEHPGDIITAYAHLSSFAVSTGQEITAGTSVGGIGCTGRCTGNHLHFEVRVDGRPVDPLPYL